ncbi:ABC transporter permease [Metasolibacillus sp.]|uniref:lmo0954 family membrane protein n=1 Tax=Metasolibacillus sp. TaxID=2703680 RepID=UPI0025FE036B|nr:ABC transporter permease [Metasolibacillus sp.]MCT6923664.1 ABC transporter permease [Metasolibacillus sp.]MCT6939613.1 ABC transporter permease [Metasolibacillus sp.]
MKKFFYFIGGAIAFIVALSLLGPMIGLLLSGLLVAAGLHYYTKSTSVFGKIMSGTLALIGFLTAASNIPAFIGLIAIVALYYIAKNWKKDSNVVEASDDPFNNFEKEWAKLSK